MNRRYHPRTVPLSVLLLYVLLIILMNTCK